MNGAKLSGRIRSFDKFSILLESNAQEQLIFKHAISTIQHARRPSGELHRAAPTGTQETAHGEHATDPPERQES